MLQLNHLLTENAVLQAGKQHYVSGKTEPNNRIKFSIADVEFEVESESDGTFLLEIPAQPYNLESILKVVSKDDSKEIYVR